MESLSIPATPETSEVAPRPSTSFRLFAYRQIKARIEDCCVKWLSRKEIAQQAKEDLKNSYENMKVWKKWIKENTKGMALKAAQEKILAELKSNLDDTSENSITNSYLKDSLIITSKHLGIHNIEFELAILDAKN